MIVYFGLCRGSLLGKLPFRDYGVGFKGYGVGLKLPAERPETLFVLEPQASRVNTPPAHLSVNGEAF